MVHVCSLGNAALVLLSSAEVFPVPCAEMAVHYCGEGAWGPPPPGHTRGNTALN